MGLNATIEKANNKIDEANIQGDECNVEVENITPSTGNEDNDTLFSL